VKWSDIASTIAKDAPLLSSALASFGSSSGGAVGAVVCSVTGTPADDPDAAAAAIAADPTLLKKLRKAEQANQPHLASYVLRNYGEQSAQTASGVLRSLQSAANPSGRGGVLKPTDILMRQFLSLAIISATIMLVFLVVLGFADGVLRDPVIAATAGGVVMYFMNESRLVTSYWFGTTRDSNDTNAHIRALVRAGTTTASKRPVSSLRNARPTRIPSGGAVDASVDVSDHRARRRGRRACAFKRRC
jgi:hypothetical protein